MRDNVHGVSSAQKDVLDSLPGEALAMGKATQQGN